MIPTVDPSGTLPSLSMGKTPSGQVEGLPGSILDKFWQEKFLDPKNPPKKIPGLWIFHPVADGRWVLVERWGVGVFEWFLVGCCFFSFWSPDLWFWMIRFDERFILFYLCSKMLQAERSMEGLWFWNISWICQMLLSWSCGIRNGPHLVESECVLVFFVFCCWERVTPPKICGIQWY